jgi:flagellin
MSLSVNNNASALLGLQSLNQTTQQLQQAENQISTGLAIGSAQDHPAVWAIAQGQSQQVAAPARSQMLRPARASRFPIF